MALGAWKYFLAFVIINTVATERIKDMIYIPLEGVAACFRRHNGTHQFGCSSSRSGSVGVVHLIEAEQDLTWIEKNATAGPYTVVMSFKMFTRNTLIRLRNTNNINGVLLANNISQDNHLDYYSPEDQCPNRYSGYKKCNVTNPWNSFGSALLMEDWPFPMFYTNNQTIVDTVKACFWAYNAHDLETQHERSLCAMEMKSFMFSAINTESCIKRSDFKWNFNSAQFCDPLGDRNIHWPLAPLNENNNTVIMVTARLDASSLFDGIAPGAGNVVTGLVTFLATAYYLNHLKPVVNNTNVLFSLLNGEAFDYIGSSRMVYDLKRNNFNAFGGTTLKFDDVKSVIEFGQLGTGEVFFHTMNDKDAVISRLGKALKATIVTDSVPPTSVQSFLEAKPSLTTVVISNHGANFMNRFYNGILDDAESIHFDSKDNSTLASDLAKIALQVANELYLEVMDTKPEPPSNLPFPMEKLITDMLYCYLESAKCNLFRAASSPGIKMISQALPLYIGVHRAPNFATSLTGQLLAFLTGEKLELNETTCHENRLAWMAGLENFTGICINSTVNYSAAVSPAFIIEGYDMKSGVYSTWTESIWQTLSVRMFLKPSLAVERLSMILGSLIAATSFILVWFINSRIDVLFNARRTVEC